MDISCPTSHAPADAARLDDLTRLLRSLAPVAIGFSGGVDSTFLAAAALRCLPARDVLLIHLDTPFVGTPERASLARERDIFMHGGAQVICVPFDPLAVPNVAANPADRCYHCKRACLERVCQIAREHGVSSVLEGSNADDACDYRPGMRAVRELGIHSPLLATGWHKARERAVLRAWGHPVWDLPAGACLATRVPCGQPLNLAALRAIRACEDLLHDLGLRQVRVRLDCGVAKVRVAECELGHPALRVAAGGQTILPRELMDAFKELGAGHVDPVVRPYVLGEGGPAAR